MHWPWLYNNDYHHVVTSQLHKGDWSLGTFSKFSCEAWGLGGTLHSKPDKASQHPLLYANLRSFQEEELSSVARRTRYPWNGKTLIFIEFLHNCHKKKTNHESSALLFLGYSWENKFSEFNLLKFQGWWILFFWIRRKTLSSNWDGWNTEHNV